MTDRRQRAGSIGTTVVVLLMAAAGPADGRQNGVVGRSGKVESVTCRACHTGTDSQTVSISGPDKVSPNQRATFTVTLSAATITASGIDIAASAGELSINAAETGLRVSGTELIHAQPKTVDASHWLFDWTAPASGTQTLYVASIAANLDGTPNGDSFGRATHTVVVSEEVDPARDAALAHDSAVEGLDANVGRGDGGAAPYVLLADGGGSANVARARSRTEVIQGGCGVAGAVDPRSSPCFALLWIMALWITIRRISAQRRRWGTRGRVIMLSTIALLFAVAPTAVARSPSTKVVVLWRGPSTPPEAQHRLGESLRWRHRVVPPWLLYEACTQLKVAPRGTRHLRRCAQRIGVDAVITNRRSGKKRLVVKILDVRRGRWLRPKTVRWGRRPTPEMVGVTSRAIKRALRSVVARSGTSSRPARTAVKRHRRREAPARSRAIRSVFRPRKPTPPATATPTPPATPVRDAAPASVAQPNTDLVVASTSSRPHPPENSTAASGHQLHTVSVSAAIGVSGRSLDVAGDGGNSRYEGGAYPEIVLRTEAYPLLSVTKSWLRQFGLSAGYAQALSVQSTSPDGTQELATTSRELLVDLRYRLLWGQRCTSPIFFASIGWGLRDFEVETNPVVTSFAYRFLRLALSAHVPLRTPLIGLSMTADLRPLYHAGIEVLKAFGDRQGGIAFALRPGVFGQTASGMQYFANFEFLSFYSRFAGRGDVLSRSGSADRADATNSKDVFLRFWVGAGYAL